MLAGRSLLNRLSEHQNWGFRRAAGKRVSVTVSYLSSQKAQRLRAFVFSPSQSDSHAPILQPAVCQIPRFSYEALKLTFYGFISAVFGLHCVFTLFIGTSSKRKSSPYGTQGTADAHAANSQTLLPQFAREEMNVIKVLSLPGETKCASCLPRESLCLCRCQCRMDPLPPSAN